MNLLSIDVEEWFTTGHLKKHVQPTDIVRRVTESTEPILELLNKKNTKATFFIVGEVAKENPLLIKKIFNHGHEIASHGYTHTPLWSMSRQECSIEIKKSKAILEDIIGQEIKGFRAPFASLNQETSWLIDILEEENFIYDSSLFPMKTPLYGIKNAPFSYYKISSTDITKPSVIGKIIEFPFSVWPNKLVNIPCTGGIYGRFLPFKILKYLLDKTIKKNNYINFYFHPWETDKNTPKIKAPIWNKIVAYHNNDIYLNKIENIIDNYCFTSFENWINIENID